MILSVEISDNSVNIVQASKKGGTLSVSKCVTVNIPSLAEDGTIIDVDYAADKINEALSRHNIKIRRAVFVVNSGSIIIRKLKLPLLRKKSEILSMIKYELEQLMPVDVSRYRIIYKIICADGDKKNACYVVYGLPVNMFAQYAGLASKLRLKASTLDICCNCLNKISQHKIDINNAPAGSNDVSAFVGIGADKITFNVLNKGVSDFSKISGFFNDDQAETAAEEHSEYLTDGFSGPDDFMYRCLDEISKYVRYYHSVENESRINKLYICGSDSPNFNEELLRLAEKNLSIEAVSLDSISNVEIDGACFSGCLDINKFFISLLALLNGREDICFLLKPNHFNVKNSGFAVSAASVAVFIFICAAAGRLTVVHNDKFKAMKIFVSDNDNVVLNNEIEDLKKDLNTLTGCAEYAGSLKAAAKSDDCVSSEIFREILYALPKDTEITSVSVDKTGTQLSCISSSIDEAALFLNNLRKIYFIESIYVPNVEIRRNTGGGYSYSVVCTLKDVSRLDN